MIRNELTDTVLKLDFANYANLKSEIAQRASQVILDVIDSAAVICERSARAVDAGWREF